VYIVYNQQNDKFYIGQTNDLHRRLEEHNTGKVNFTSKYRGSWELVFKEEFLKRTEAIQRENFLKKQKNKIFYKRLCNLF